MQPGPSDKKNKKDDWNFGIYFDAKKRKLYEQFEENRDILAAGNNDIAKIFANIGIFVNGFTIPTASELRVLMMKHGGEFHEYMNDRVTHIIASNLAQTKVAHMRNKTVVKPEWILDSVKANKVLNIEDYSLEVMNRLSRCQNKLNDFIEKGNKLQKKEEVVLNQALEIIEQQKTPTPTKHQQNHTVDAKNENFLNDFYGKSRLHLISTLATDLKLYVNNLRNRTIVREIKPLPAKVYNTKSPAVTLSQNERVVFHIDIDCFFVSVSLRDKPHLQNEPVGIAHSKGQNARNEDNFSYSEIASCNYEARKFGVKNGMLVGTAKRICPNIKLVDYDFEAYSKCSKEIYELVSWYTHDLKAVSCDEMFVDFTSLVVKSENRLNPLDIASFIRQELRTQINCPSSIGIGDNMLIARLATRKAKPNGQVWIRPGEETLNFISKMEINTLPGIGSSIMSKISMKWKITTCEELRAISKVNLQATFGSKIGTKLFEFSRGLDTRPFLENETSTLNEAGDGAFKKSISTDVNYGIRFDTNDQVYDFLGRLSTELCDRLKRYNLQGTKLTLKVRIRDPEAPVQTKKFMGCGICSEKSVSVPIHLPTNEVDIVTQSCVALYRQNFLLNTDCKDLRGLGLQMDKLKSASQVPANAANSFFTVKSRPKASFNIPVITLDTDEESSVKNDAVETEAFNAYDTEFALFRSKVQVVLLSRGHNAANDDELTEKEIDCIKFILNDWIYWSSNLNRTDRSLFSDDVYIFKGFLLYLVNHDEHLESLEKIMKLFKHLIIQNGSCEWIAFYKECHDEIQANFFEKNNATLDIEDS